MAKAQREYVDGLKLWNGMYYGEVLHDKPHGKGRLVKNNGDVESGTYKNGMPDKKMVTFYANGDIAEYTLEKHNVVGKYKLTYSNGEVCIHEYEPGKKIGVCWHYYPDGSYYKGVYNQGKRDKTGVMVYPDGRAELWTYDFGYLKGKKLPLDKNDPRVKDAHDPEYVPTPPPVPEFPVGKDALQKTKKTEKKQTAAPAPKKQASPAATEKEASKAAAPAKTAPKKAEPPRKTTGHKEFSNGDIYEGDLLDGKPHGKGKYISQEGWTYVGGWENNLRSGKGTIRWSDGRCYEGDWENDHRQGNGTFRWADGEIYEGEWIEGRRTGRGTYRWADGDCYEGDFVNNTRTGYGRYEHYTDKWQTKHFCDLVYEGQWRDGEKHGKGVEKHYIPGVNQDVTVYEGEWVNGKREGIFVWYLFYPATGKESSKDMQYYQNGKVVIESIPYDASIKTYEDFAAAKSKLDAAVQERKRKEAAANDPYNEKLYRELFYLKQTGKAGSPRFADLSAQLHSKENIEAIVSKIMRQNDMSKVSIEDASFVLFLYNKFVKQGANTQYMAWCYYRLGDYKKAAGCLIGEAMAYSYLKKAEGKRELWQICLHINSSNADYCKELAIDRIKHARAELEAARKEPIHYQADSIREQIEDVELQLGMW